MNSYFSSFLKLTLFIQTMTYLFSLLVVWTGEWKWNIKASVFQLSLLMSLLVVCQCVCVSAQFIPDKPWLSQLSFITAGLFLDLGCFVPQTPGAHGAKSILTFDAWFHITETRISPSLNIYTKPRVFFAWDPNYLLQEKILGRKSNICLFTSLTRCVFPHPPLYTVGYMQHFIRSKCPHKLEKWECIASVALGITSRFPRTQSARWNKLSEWRLLLSAQTAQFIVSEIYEVISRLCSERLFMLWEADTL